MRVAVLGAGLQGAGVAMELATSGVAVDLYDKNEQCVSQASARNEGKIHLGYVYANDATLNTARIMIKGALAFSPLLRRWLGPAVDALRVSAPFHYAVHARSLLAASRIEQHLERCHALALEEHERGGGDYFGIDYRITPVRLSAAESKEMFDPRRVQAAFRTPEVGIDPEALAALVRQHLATAPHIRCVLRTRAVAVAPDDEGVTITTEQDGREQTARYDHVVNTLWEGRLTIDRTAGVHPPRPWMYRVKHYLRAQTSLKTAGLPSTTIVLGAFGDVVAYPDGGMYLSWYPAGMRGSSLEMNPPAWPLTLDDSASIELRAAIVAGLGAVLPAVQKLAPEIIASAEVQAGIIFAWGDTDIHDATSGLHERHAIGPHSHGRYHSIDTGKLTMAPLFGKMMAEQLQRTG